MIPPRRSLVAALVATAPLAAGAPAATASTPVPILTPSGVPFSPGVGNVGTAGACARSSGNEGQGGTGEASNQVCMGAGLTFIGPSSGQIATVIGPTIIGPAFVGALVVSAGNGAVGP
jgi:hypothetical protein